MKIESERLILAVPSLDRIDDILKFYTDNESHLEPWDPKKPENFFTQEYWQEKTQAAMEEFEKGVSVRFNLYIKETNELIGMINFTTLERGPFQNSRVGYKIGEQFQGQGYMSEGLSRGIEYMFNTLNFHRVEANYIPLNERSGKLLKRLGFEEHGIAKNYLRIAGKWKDHILTSKTNPNWKED
tara:strand:- start:8835 stop:9386 length:552 start_codon:yes stop_codon:yes gene_type:complete